MPYIVRRATEQPIRKVIYFSQRKRCFCKRAGVRVEVSRLCFHRAAAQMASDDTAMNMYGGGRRDAASLINSGK